MVLQNDYHSTRPAEIRPMHSSFPRLNSAALHPIPKVFKDFRVSVYSDAIRFIAMDVAINFTSLYCKGLVSIVTGAHFFFAGPFCFIFLFSRQVRKHF